MSKVLIVLGSQSDEPVMKEAKQYLDWFGIESEMMIASAHRNPEKVASLASNAQRDGYTCIIGAAGMAAALPGVLAAHTQLPVLGVPLDGGIQGGVDALYSIVQMPPGVPVGTLAVGKAGAKNSAVMAARIAALNDDSVAFKLDEFKKAGFKI